MRLLLLLAALGAAPCAASPELVSIPTRPGVTQSFVILPLEGPPRAIGLLYVGGGGRINARREGDRVRFGARYELVSVSGGKPPESGPCDPLSAHGYFAWMLQRPFPKQVP